MEAPYTGPFEVLRKTDKYFVIKTNNDLHSTVSIDRLKPHIEPKTNKQITEKQPHSDKIIMDTENKEKNDKSSHTKVEKFLGRETTNITITRLRY